MLVLRGTVTQHPRGSTSTPAMSPHYWIPPTSVSCSGVTELQALLAPFSAAALLHQGASPPLPPTGPPSGVPAVETAHDVDADTVVVSSPEPSGAHVARQPPAEESRARNMAFLITALVAFGGLVVVVLNVGRALQPRDVMADELRATDAARHPLVQEPALGRGYDDGANAAVRVTVKAVPVVANHSVTVHKADHSYNETTTFFNGRSVRRDRLDRRGRKTKSRKGRRKRRQRSSTTTVSVDEYFEGQEASSDIDKFLPVSAPSENESGKYLRKSYRRRGKWNASQKFSSKRGTKIVGKVEHVGLVQHNVMTTSAGVETAEWFD